MNSTPPTALVVTQLKISILHASDVNNFFYKGFSREKVRGVKYGQDIEHDRTLGKRSEPLAQMHPF
jgi:hypothetical protein